MNRRQALQTIGNGFGMLGLCGMLAGNEQNPLAARQPHFAPKAKRLIYLFLNGGPSQVDTFDPKPLLTKYHGQAIPGEFLKDEKVKKQRQNARLLASPFSFKKYGQSGLEVSELFAKTAQHVDDMCFIRSMHADTPNHEQSMRLMNCGDERLSRPSLGAWVTYGLGSENANLPGFVVLCPGLPVDRKSTRLNSSHLRLSRMPSSA